MLLATVWNRPFPITTVSKEIAWNPVLPGFHALLIPFSILQMQKPFNFTDPML